MRENLRRHHCESAGRSKDRPTHTNTNDSSLLSPPYWGVILNQESTLRNLLPGATPAFLGPISLCLDGERPDNSSLLDPKGTRAGDGEKPQDNPAVSFTQTLSPSSLIGSNRGQVYK